MPVIEIEIRNKIARQSNDVPYVCNNDDYSLAFDFDAEWDAYPLKTARFSYNGKYFEVVFSGNTCQVPVMEDTSSIDVGVYAGDLRATTPVAVLAKKSILCGDDIQHEAPPEDVYNQIMAELNEEGRWIENTKAEAVTAANEANEAKTAAIASAQTAKDAASAAEADKKLALQHASSASDSQKLAADAANAALSHKEEAQTSANLAEQSAQSADSSAADAADSATSAANKASAAASSAANAEASARAAAQRESAAANEAAAAAAYAGTAAQAATVAESKASEADSSATKAAMSESSAASKASEAADSAKASAQNQSAAGVSATAAADSAKAAAQSEAAAAQSAGNAAAAATNAANAVLETAKESGEFDGPVGKDGTSFFYSTASPGTVIGSLYGFDLSTIETNGRTISAGDFILSAVGYIYRVEANLGTYVNAVCIQRGVGVDGSSLFYSTMDADHYVGGRWAIALDTISTFGRKISEGDLIFAANDFLYCVVGVRATEVDGECLQRWSGIDGLCIYQTYSTPTKTSSGSRYYTISGGQIETSGRQFSVGDLILAGDGEMYRIDALLDQPPNHLYLEWLTRWRGRDGGIQTVNGIEPDENGNVEIVAGTQPDWNQNDPDALDYVKNRTHWEERSFAEILPECQPRYASGDNVFWVDQTIEGVEVGNTYVVSWNGTEYECVAQEIRDMDVSAVILGDIYTLSDGSVGIAPTGEPFAIGIFSADTAASLGAGAQVKPFDGTTELTLSIYSKTNFVHKLSGKFLPDGVPYVEEGGLVEILPDYTITEDNSEADIAAIPALGLVAGATYTVTLNGTEYTCVATLLEEDGLSAVCLGDAYTLTGGQVGTAPTGEPFVLLEYSPELAVELGMNVAVQPLSENITLPITFSIYSGGVTVHKLDNRCLDLAWLPTSELSTVIEETTVEHNTYMGDFGYGQFPVGTEVVVLVDGTPYKTTVQTAGEGTDQYWFAAIGNVAQVTMLLNNSHWSFADGASHQVEICIEGYNKMPAEFLPKGTPYVQEDVLLAETNAESSEDPTFGQIWVIQGVTLNLTAGETYTILYNGTPYKCVCQTAPDGFTNDPDAVAMGNFAAIGGEDTGEPFALLSQPNYKAIAIIDFVGSTAVKVGISGEVAQKMDARCLPDNIGGGFTVTVDLSTGTANKTGVEICAAVKAGKPVFIALGDDIGTFVYSTSEGDAVFSGLSLEFTDDKITSVTQHFACVYADGSFGVLS